MFVLVCINRGWENWEDVTCTTRPMHMVIEANYSCFFSPQFARTDYMYRVMPRNTMHPAPPTYPHNEDSLSVYFDGKFE